MITKEEIAKTFPSHMCDLTRDCDTSRINIPSHIGYMKLCGYRFPIYKREGIYQQKNNKNI